MGKSKKRASSPAGNGEGGLIDQGRLVAEGFVKDLQKRLPPDLVKQVEKAVGQGQKTVQGSLQAIQAQLKNTAKQSDVDRLTKRIDALARHLERLVAAAPRGAAPPSAPEAEAKALKPPEKAPTRRKPAAAKSAAAKPASKPAEAKEAAARPAKAAATPGATGQLASTASTSSGATGGTSGSSKAPPARATKTAAVSPPGPSKSAGRPSRAKSLQSGPLSGAKAQDASGKPAPEDGDKKSS